MFQRCFVALLALATLGGSHLIAQARQLELPMTFTAFAVSTGGPRTPAVASQVDITIQDNGCGFIAEKTTEYKNGGGFGLKGISERARMLGARYVVQSAAGQGTSVTVNLEMRNGRSSRIE